MSDIQRNIVTNWISRGAQGVRAQIGMVNSALLGLDRTEQRVGRSSSILNNQLRALGTTVRYALSGFTVYGVLGAVQNLQTLQESMAAIAAIGEQPGLAGRPLATEQLSQMRDDILRISTDIAQPAEDIANSVTQIFSTLQNVSPGQATAFARIFSMLTRTTASKDVQLVGQGLLGTMMAFGIPQNQRGAMGTANMIRKFIQTSALFTGESFAQFTPQALTGARLSGLDPSQFFSLLTLMTRQGGTPAVASRHLGQLLRNLRTPPKESQKFFDQIGLDVNTLASLPPVEILRRMMEAVQGAGGATAAPMPSEALENLMGTEGNRDVGISGPGSILAANLLKRAESRRAFVVLMQNWLGTANLAGYERLIDIYNRAAGNANELADANERALDQIPITRAQQAWRNFFTSLVSEADPVFRMFADLSETISNFATSGSRQRQAVLAGAGGGLLALLLGRRLLAGRGMPLGGLGRLFGAGTAAFAIAQGIKGETSQMTAPKGTVSDPIFVVVLYQLGGGKFAPVVGPGGTGAGRGGGRLGRVLPFLAGVPLGLAATTAAAVVASAGATRQPRNLGRHQLFNLLLSEHPEMFDPSNRNAMRQVRQGLLGGVRAGFISPETARTRMQAFAMERRILRDYQRGYINMDVAEQRLRSVATRNQLSAAGVGRMKVEWGDKPLKIQLTGKDLKNLQAGKRKMYHVTKDLFDAPVFSVPQNRGRHRPGNRRD